MNMMLGSNTSVWHVFICTQNYVFQCLLINKRTLQTFHFSLISIVLMCKRKIKYFTFKILNPPPLRMTQSAPLQIDNFKWQLSQVWFRTENIQIGYSEKQICKCPPCNIQILIFAFQNFFEWYIHILYVFIYLYILYVC